MSYEQERDLIPIGLVFNRPPEKDNEFIDLVKDYVEKNKYGITTSQLRNIFAKIKPIEYKKENLSDINLLRIKFAYISGRSDKREMKNLCGFLDKLISEVKNQENWNQFKNFFEAIIAYHKYFGGK